MLSPIGGPCGAGLRGGWLPGSTWWRSTGELEGGAVDVVGSSAALDVEAVEPSWPSPSVAGQGVGRRAPPRGGRGRGAGTGGVPSGLEVAGGQGVEALAGELGAVAGLKVAGVTMPEHAIAAKVAGEFRGSVHVREVAPGPACDASGLLQAPRRG
jgi:hypothetical protein